MEKTVIKAIKGSIAKWDLIAHGVGVDSGTANCPLCKMFFVSGFGGWGAKCNECPVAERVYVDKCGFTPYSDIHLNFDITVPDWIKELNIINRTYINETIDAIQEEIEFLILLLPCEDREQYNL